jgi:hypothetical protein
MAIIMLKLKPTFIEENGKARFVVFSMKDFKAITSDGWYLQT